MATGRTAMGGRGGFTLVEVMVATLITATLAVALMHVALSTKATGVKLDRKLLASQTTKALQSQLKAYVTGDPTSTKNWLCGPNTFNGSMTSCNANMWCLANNMSGGPQSDSYVGPGGANGCYALNPGIHTIHCSTSGEDDRCVMPWALRQPPYNGHIEYTVAYLTADGAPQVKINVIWYDENN